ncbi:MAG: hypothetical protein FD127_2095, partial [Acidimicrobiaceae bacterium]
MPISAGSLQPPRRVSSRRVSEVATAASITNAATRNTVAMASDSACVTASRRGSGSE